MRKLMYTPHPSYSVLTSSFPKHLVVEDDHIFEIYPRDFRRLMKICSDLTDEIVGIKPDFIQDYPVPGLDL